MSHLEERDDGSVEAFPHQFEQVAENRHTGKTSSRTVHYRFVQIRIPDGWVNYPGQNCHEGLGGLFLPDDEGRWWDQDLWGANCEGYTLDIGCYGGVRSYVCNAHAPDWHGRQLEQRIFGQAEEAAAWAESWMKYPKATEQELK